MPFNELMVPTADTVRYSYLIENLVQRRAHLLCVGKTGTGKTLTVTQALMHPHQGLVGTTPIFMAFSARTSANQVKTHVHPCPTSNPAPPRSP